jgi:Fe2+ or Zn2+ uptake regulation protein
MKVTHHRLVILQYLEKHQTHPTAEEIYSALKVKNPSLSKTTVYNSLESLKQHDIIQTLTISATETRYDFKHDMHHHFLCKRCGKIIDIDIACPNIKKISNYGHQVQEVHGYFKGICKDCLKNRD